MSTKEPVSTTSYEFTKRKRWADLLVSELADTIIFVLSGEGKVLYVGTAVTELLGWREVDLVDCDFGEIVSGNFRLLFDAILFFRAKSTRSWRPRHFQDDLFRECADPPGSTLLCASEMF